MNYRIDGQKLVFHPKRVVEWLGKKDDWETAKEIYPIYVEISPVGVCMHACTFCAIDYVMAHHKASMMKAQLIDAEVLRARLMEMGSLGVKSVMFAGEGEPLLHREINSFVQVAKFSGLDVSFTTNGVLLDKLDMEGVSWVKVSINGGHRKTYGAVHRAKDKDWDIVWANVAGAVKRKGSCTLGVQMVLLPENAGEVQELYDRCNDLGVDYLVVKPYSQHKYSETRVYEHAEPFVPEVKTGTTQYIFRRESYDTKSIGYEKCQATPYLWAYLMTSGDLYSCSAYLLDPRFLLGNLNENSFKEVWQSEKRKANWQFVRETLDIHDCRLNCRMDKANIYLNDLVKGVPHVGFI